MAGSSATAHRQLLVLCLASLFFSLVGCGASSETLPGKSLLQRVLEPDLHAALAAPRVFGEANAPHLLYVSTNPQCPPCRRDWPALHALIKQLDASLIQVQISGFGFSDQGTQLMYAAALLSAYSPQASLDFLDAVFSAASAPYIEGPAWIFRQLAALKLPESFPRALADPVLAQSWINATRARRASYHLAYTPSYVFDQQLLPGLPAVDALLNGVIHPRNS